MSHPQDPPPGARPGREDLAKENDLYDVRCNIQRSIRYHRARERFFQWWANAISFASLLSGSAVVVSLLAAGPKWTSLAFGAVVAVLQAIELVLQVASKARLHNGLAAEFSSCERMLAAKARPTEEDLRSTQVDILAIEAREPPVKRFLDLLCHNQVARALGSDDVEYLSGRHRLFAQWLDGDDAMERSEHLRAKAMEKDRQAREQSVRALSSA